MNLRTIQPRPIRAAISMRIVGTDPCTTSPTAETAASPSVTAVLVEYAAFAIGNMCFEIKIDNSTLKLYYGFQKNNSTVQSIALASPMPTEKAMRPLIFSGVIIMKDLLRGSN